MSGTAQTCPGCDGENGVNQPFFTKRDKAGQTGTAGKTLIGKPGQTGTHSYRSVPLSRPGAGTVAYRQIQPAMIAPHMITARNVQARLMGCSFSAISARPSLVDDIIETITARATIASTACIGSTPVSDAKQTSKTAAKSKLNRCFSTFFRVLPAPAAVRGRRAAEIQPKQYFSEGFRSHAA